METPTVPTREELGKFLPSQRVIRAIEQLFQWVTLLGNPPFGEMYATNASIVVSVAASGTKYEIGSGLTAGSLNFMSFGGAHYLETEISAKYLVVWSISADGATVADEIEAGILVGGVAIPNGTAHTTVSAVNEATCMAASAIVDADALDQLSLYVVNNTAARDITVEHVSFTVSMLKSA